MTKEPPRQIACKTTSTATELGRAVVLTLVVPERDGMEVEVVLVAIMSMKNVPAYRLGYFAETSAENLRLVTIR